MRGIERKTMYDETPFLLQSSVEQKQEDKYSQADNNHLSTKLLPYIQMAFIIVTGFAMVSMGLRISSKPINEVIDLFSPYMDIFPGNPISATQARGFLCNSHNDFYPVHVEHCYFTPVAGRVYGIYVVASENIIRQTTFTMRNDSLMLGDLVLLSKSHDFSAYLQEIIFFSSKGFSIWLTDTAVHRYLFRPVWSVSFINHDPLQ